MRRNFGRLPRRLRVPGGGEPLCKSRFLQLARRRNIRGIQREKPAPGQRFFPGNGGTGGGNRPGGNNHGGFGGVNPPDMNGGQTATA